jgi:integrase
MPVRARGKKLEWRFKVNGQEYSHITDLADTPRNRIKAQRLEAEARRLVMDGRGTDLRIQIQPFSSAADAFIQWARGEYTEHPNSWKRLRGSMASLKVMFGKRPLSSIVAGDLEDYKSWRRGVHKVREVTIRHDLHALSLLFQYGRKHTWCRDNPVREIEMPSDKDAVRMNVLTHQQEALYFAACEALRDEKLKAGQTLSAQGFQDLYDLHKLMRLQGCRPEELRALPQAKVNLEYGRFTVSGKSAAAKRTLSMRTEAHEILARRLSVPGKWVFPSSKNPGRHISEHQRLHEAVVKRSGVLCVPYDFRHTFATRAANDEKMPLGTLKAIMGHANLASIMKYVHVQQQDMDREMARLDVRQEVTPESQLPSVEAQPGKLVN